jgi:hypothetical protein
MDGTRRIVLKTTDKPIRNSGWPDNGMAKDETKKEDSELRTANQRL